MCIAAHFLKKDISPQKGLRIQPERNILNKIRLEAEKSISNLPLPVIDFIDSFDCVFTVPWRDRGVYSNTIHKQMREE